MALIHPKMHQRLCKVHGDANAPVVYNNLVAMNKGKGWR